MATLGHEGLRSNNDSSNSIRRFRRSATPDENASIASDQSRSLEIRKKDEIANNTTSTIMDRFEIVGFSGRSLGVLEESYNYGFVHLVSASLKKDKDGKIVKFQKNIFDNSITYVSGEVVLSTQPDGKGEKRTINVDGPYVGISSMDSQPELTEAEKKRNDAAKQIIDKYQLSEEELKERIKAGEEVGLIQIEELDEAEAMIKRTLPSDALRQLNSDDVTNIAFMLYGAFSEMCLPQEFRLAAAQELLKVQSSYILDSYKKNQYIFQNQYDSFLERELKKNEEENIPDETEE